MITVEVRRAVIDKLIECALNEASQRKKSIETVDPIIKCAQYLFPYLPDNVLHEYSRTALRLIVNRRARDVQGIHQTTLLTCVTPQ